MVRVTAIVMAAGMSRRMGKDKLHMKLNNKNIYEYILDTIKNYCFYETIVVAKDEDILKKARSLGFLGVENNRYFLGQSESIKAALEVSGPADGFMFFVADQPFIKPDTIKKLCNKFRKNPSSIIVPYYNGVKGSPVIFPYYLKEQLMNLQNDNGGKVVIDNNKDKVISVDIITENEFLDIDTMEDYQKASNIKF